MKRLDLDLRKCPIIGDDFDIVCFDLFQYDSEEKLYTMMLSFLYNNHDEKKLEGALTFTTGISYDNYPDFCSDIDKIVSTGFFLTPVSAIGTVYDKDFNEIDTINWNEIHQFSTDKPDPVSNPTFH
jgi:hypothetical protein